jgi:hypothetical protein
VAASPKTKAKAKAKAKTPAAKKAIKKKSTTSKKAAQTGRGSITTGFFLPNVTADPSCCISDDVSIAGSTPETVIDVVCPTLPEKQCTVITAVGRETIRAAATRTVVPTGLVESPHP